MISQNGCLDPAHPEALDYIRQDVRQICDWGYQLIKHDFSTYDLFGMWGFEANLLNVRDDWHFYDRGKTSAQIVTLLYEAICQEAAPKDVLILGCNTIGHLGAGLMHLNRTGDDPSTALSMMWMQTVWESTEVFPGRRTGSGLRSSPAAALRFFFL